MFLFVPGVTQKTLSLWLVTRAEKIDFMFTFFYRIEDAFTFWHFDVSNFKFGSLVKKLSGYQFYYKKKTQELFYSSRNVFPFSKYSRSWGRLSMQLTAYKIWLLFLKIDVIGIIKNLNSLFASWSFLGNLTSQGEFFFKNY